MCLVDVVIDPWERNPGGIEWVDRFKVIRWNPRLRRWAIGPYFGDSIVRTQYHTAHDMPPAQTSPVSSYPTGYHVFLSLEDAEAYMHSLPPSYRLKVVRVGAWRRLAYGTQMGGDGQGWPSEVYLRLKIPPETDLSPPNE